MGIPGFFSLPTVLPALTSIGTGAFYGFCAFKGESGVEIKPKSASNADTNDHKKSSLASQGVVPGVV